MYISCIVFSNISFHSNIKIFIYVYVIESFEKYLLYIIEMSLLKNSM